MSGPKPPQPARRRPGLRRLAAAAQPLASRAIRRRGFVETAIIHRWSAIVGDVIAGQCAPDRISFGRDNRGATLHLLVPGAHAPVLQHLEPLLLERINTVFGYAAVRRITLRQGPVPAPPKPDRRPLRALEPDEERWVSEQTRQVRDPNLQAALEALGRTILAAN